jgi:integration host factor subunit beta
MIKSDLTKLIHDLNPHLKQRDAENIVDAILDQLVEAMAHGDRVELRKFGSFSVKRRAARIAQNPRTGASVAVPQRAHPQFKASKEIRKRLNAASPGGRPTVESEHAPTRG